MKEIESVEEFEKMITLNNPSNFAFQDLDLLKYENELINSGINNCLFLGCTISNKALHQIIEHNFIFPDLNVPFNIYPGQLYNRRTLYDKFQITDNKSYNKCLDKVIYDHLVKTGKTESDIKESLARKLHDHSITDALYDFLEKYDEKKRVAIMGGHGLSRNDEKFKNIAFLSKQLTEIGYLMISGGGPGAMEATHLGAWFAGKSDDLLTDAIQILSDAPLYNHEDWLRTTFTVIQKYPESKYYSLGIPTWLYGHEPPTPFATHIAKYFTNSVREEGLLAIAKGGIIFTPGSAGTLQEIFQEITQNHYETYGYASPMIFYNKQFWTVERPFYPVIEQMKNQDHLKNLDLGIYDNIDDIIDHIKRFTDQ